MLRELERSRSLGLTVDELAQLSGVTTRTVRRDLQALEEAGFPIFDDKSHDDGRTRWRVNGQSFKGLGAGMTLSELCALYFSRTLLQSLAGTPFRDDVETAFEKLAAVLTPHMRTFLDQLPRVIATKADATARPGGDASAIVGRALDATLHLRQARIVYHSKSSDRTKEYLVHPYKLAYANGASYLLAYVPDYGEVRTFAIDRIREMSLLEERFTPIEELPDTAFPHSLGVHSGPPERIEIEFQPTVADYVRSRVWHASQTIQEDESGALRMTLDVCLDRALQSWILSFGPFARVAAPESLVRAIAEQFEEARQRYAS